MTEPSVKACAKIIHLLWPRDVRNDVERRSQIRRAACVIFIERLKPQLKRHHAKRHESELDIAKSLHGGIYLCLVFPAVKFGSWFVAKQSHTWCTRSFLLTVSGGPHGVFVSLRRGRSPIDDSWQSRVPNTYYHSAFVKSYFTHSAAVPCVR